MYAAHFAAGLAIGSRVPRAPMWALLAGAVLPDIVWIGLSGIGVEPANSAVFFDDWSHSLLSVTVLAVVFALCFARMGRGVALAVSAAVASHFALDGVIHPRPLALFPHSSVRLPWDLWHWGEGASWFGQSHYWWVQFAVVMALLMIYLAGARRRGIATNVAWASALILIGMQFVF